MATLEQREEAIKQAQALLAELTAIKPTTLARTEDLSRDINFSEAVPHFEDTLEIVKQPSIKGFNRTPVNSAAAKTGNFGGGAG